MAAGNYFVTGRLGSGKSLYAIDRIYTALQDGLRVATNLDVYTEKMPGHIKNGYTRLPDKPTREHLEQLGTGYDMSQGYHEDKFGVLVLDECLTWLNSRAWQDKERHKVIDWFLHARKLGWSLVFILQDADFVDPQVREPLLDYHVRCRQMGRLWMPVIGKALNLKMPNATWATIYNGYGPTAIKQDTLIYRSKELWDYYDTRQVFQSGLEIVGQDLLDMRANMTILSPWHIHGRYTQKTKTKRKTQLYLTAEEKNLLRSIRLGHDKRMPTAYNMA